MARRPHTWAVLLPLCFLLAQLAGAQPSKTGPSLSLCGLRKHIQNKLLLPDFTKRSSASELSRRG